MGKRRQFTKEFKLQILEELNSSSLAEVCREHTLHPTLVIRWRKEYENNPSDAFGGNGKIWKEDAKFARYERLLGELYAKNSLLEKEVERLRILRAEERKKKK